MPTTSRRSRVPVRRAKRPKQTTTARKNPARNQALTDHEAHIDGCDVEFNESEQQIDGSARLRWERVENGRFDAALRGCAWLTTGVTDPAEE